jgi:hypothetical protein
MSKIIRIATPVLMALSAGIPFASAQHLNAYYSVGTAMDSSSNTQINTFGTGNFTTPEMGGLFSDFGAGYMFTIIRSMASAVTYRGGTRRPLMRA